MKNLLITLIAIMASLNSAHAEEQEVYTLGEYVQAYEGTRPRLGDENMGVTFKLLGSDLDLEDIEYQANGEQEFNLDTEITALVFYMAQNHNHINGIEIEYSNGETKSIGKKNGNKNRKTINDGDYINELKIFGKEKDDDFDCRSGKAKVNKLRFRTANGDTLRFGKDRAYDCEREEWKHNQRLVGLYGTYKNGKIYSLGPIWMRYVELQFEEVVVTDPTELTEINDMRAVSGVIENNTPGTIEWSITIGQTKSTHQKNSWSNSSVKTRSVGMSLGLTVNYGLASGTATVDTRVTNMDNQTVGESFENSNTHSQETSLMVSVPPRHVYAQVNTITNRIITESYEAVFTDLNDDCNGCTVIKVHGEFEESESTSSFSGHSHVGMIEDGAIILSDDFVNDPNCETVVASYLANENGWDIHGDCE